MLLYICVKFHENISNGFGVTERTKFCNRRTDDQGKNKMSPNPTRGDIININTVVFVVWSNELDFSVGLG